MKLKIFTKENTGHVRSSKPGINLNTAGSFTLNKSAAEIMQLKVGDAVAIAQDEDDEDNWYVFKCKSDEGFIVRPCNGKNIDGGLSFNSSFIMRKILKAAGINHHTSMLISIEPNVDGKIKYYPIIISSARKKEEE